MPRRQIVAIESNVKSRRTWKLNFNRSKIILQGQPYSGKSTVIEAINLALRGQGDDVLFASPKTSAGLLPLIGHEQRSLFSVITFDDGSKATFGMDVKGKGKFSSPEHTMPEWMRGHPASAMLPLVDVKARLLKAPERAMDAFLSAAGVEVSAKDAQDKLTKASPKSARAAMEELTTGTRAVGQAPTQGIPWLLWVRRNASEAQKDAQSAARGLEAKAEEVTPSNETTSQEEIDQLEADLAWAEQGLSQKLWRCLQLWEEYEVAPEVAAGKEDLEAATGRSDRQQALDEIAAITPYLEAARELGKLMAYMEHPSLGDLQDWDDYLEAQNLWLQDQPEEEIPEATTRWKHIVLDEYQTLYGELGVLLESWGFPAETDEEAWPWPQEDPGEPNLLKMRMDIATKKMLLTKQEAKVEVAAVAKDSRADAAGFKDLIDTIDQVTGALLGANKGALEEAISRYLPKGDRAVLITEAFGKDELFLPAISHNGGHPGPALSGFEGNAMLMALAACTLPKDLPFTCLIPEDRGRSPEGMSGLMSAWALFDGQVIITTTDNYVPEDKRWEIIQITRGMFQ